MAGWVQRLGRLLDVVALSYLRGRDVILWEDGGLVYGLAVDSAIVGMGGLGFAAALHALESDVAEEEATWCGGGVRFID